MSTKIRRTYVAPTLNVFIVELENSIASGSAQVVVQSPNQDVDHLWESNVADEREIYW
ncbi:hypothetical protein M8998_10655 [Sphingobacterium sp. lm-10]|uniref:hypothetical protein n=1 Tax=Sphingobacterium sp. lm-10 TaxID=2944904 RepID=UPI00201FF996|nr:hypothetical protein [Sphingobacterium sp. lm-10]MCL7988399.1 hypothetical protein [Sphingobacterium sp. lm-10]